MSLRGKFSIEAIFEAVDNISAPISKIESRLLGLSKSTAAGLGAVNSMTGQVHAGLMRVAGATVAAGAGLGVVAMDVGRTGMAFEQQIADLGAVSLKSRDQIADLEAKARELGATTKFTATEVAAGMELMAKAGFENEDILGGISGMLAAAAAEGGEFAETAGHISNVLKGMGLETSQAGEVADVLALASVRTNSSISSLGESLSNVSATAREFKIPLKDVVAGVALLQDVGLDASVAGSAMNTMLVNLAKPSDKAKASMAALGIKFQDVHGNMLPLPKVLEQFGKAAQKSGGNMKVAAFFAELVGLRGQKAATNLATMFKEGKFQALATELENAAGSAERMAKLRMDTLGGDLETLGGSIDEMKIRLFDLNSGPLREVVQRTAAWVDANKDLIISRVQDFITGVVDHLPEIVMWLERIGKGLLVFYTFSTAVKVASFSIEAYETVVKLAALGTKAWRLGLLATRTTLVATTTTLGVFNAEAAASATGLTGLRAGLNAGALSTQINGVTSLLGKAGLLGAALAVGLAFGTWLDTTFKLSDKINDLIGDLNGLNKARGERTDKPGLQKGADQVLGDGTIVDAKGGIVKMGEGTKFDQRTGTFSGAGARHIAAQERNSFLREEDGFSKMRMTPAMRRDFLRVQALHHGQPAPELGATGAPQVVTPGERTTRAISETTRTEKSQVEVTVKATAGTEAEVTKAPKGGRHPLRVKTQPSGAL